MIRRPPRSTLDRSSAASDVYKRQIMSRPLTLLEDLASAVRRGDWAMLLRGDDGAASQDVGIALSEVGALIGETRKTATEVLGASSDVARIGATVADGAGRVTTSLT